MNKHLEELTKMLKYCTGKMQELKNKGGYEQAQKSAQALEWAINGRLDARAFFFFGSNRTRLEEKLFYSLAR